MLFKDVSALSEVLPGMMIVLRGRTSTPCVGYCKGLLASAMMRRSAGDCVLRGKNPHREDVYKSTKIATDYMDTLSFAL